VKTAAGQSGSGWRIVALIASLIAAALGVVVWTQSQQIISLRTQLEKRDGSPRVETSTALAPGQSRAIDRTTNSLVPDQDGQTEVLRLRAKAARLREVEAELRQVRSELQQFRAGAPAQSVQPPESPAVGNPAPALPEPALVTRRFKLDPARTLALGREFDSENAARGVSVALRNMFQQAGVELEPPKSLFYKDDQGSLLVKATAADLELIERTIGAAQLGL